MTRTIALFLVLISVTPALSQTPVVWLKLDGNITDSGSGAHTFSIAGGPLSYVTGKLGQGVNLNGTTQYIWMNHAADLNPTATGATITAWMNASTLDSTTANGDQVVSKADWNNDNSYGFYFYNGQLRCCIGRNFAAGVNYPVTNFVAGTWYHLTCRGGPTGHSIFVNGVSVATNATASQAVTNTSQGLVIGGSWLATGWFAGILDDVRIYMVPLSDSAIAQIAGVAKRKGRALMMD